MDETAQDKRERRLAAKRSRGVKRTKEQAQAAMIARVLKETKQQAHAVVRDLNVEDAEEVAVLALERLMVAYDPEGSCNWSLLYLDMLRQAVMFQARAKRRVLEEQLATAIEEWVEQGERARRLVLWHLQAVRMPCRGVLEAWLSDRSERPRASCLRQLSRILAEGGLPQVHGESPWPGPKSPDGGGEERSLAAGRWLAE
jgi:hypothetical protein